MKGMVFCWACEFREVPREEKNNNQTDFFQVGSHSNWVLMELGIKLAQSFWWCSGRLEVKIDIDQDYWTSNGFFYYGVLADFLNNWLNFLPEAGLPPSLNKLLKNISYVRISFTKEADSITPTPSTFPNWPWKNCAIWWNKDIFQMFDLFTHPLIISTAAIWIIQVNAAAISKHPPSLDSTHRNDDNVL